MDDSPPAPAPQRGRRLLAGIALAYAVLTLAFFAGLVLAPVRGETGNVLFPLVSIGAVVSLAALQERSRLLPLPNGRRKAVTVVVGLAWTVASVWLVAVASGTGWDDVATSIPLGALAWGLGLVFGWVGYRSRFFRWQRSDVPPTVVG
ncbi:hypothetical protein AS850_07525 [Frondihabitans sp. 762G35]|uniref:hypothetical protein n=1 Tax=Frondihabitans sp. 762G35 TaxID=1446794 RepID=UPI000D2164B6|nr:hypothetical protein [Frondihabitans sp. 762G35]ARC56926.1 hypothetical protein AS850_07525 [Frondihabitans sp. 762G35]